MINKSPDELSRDYYQFVSEFTQTEFEDEKILGKFYTDIDITQNMIQLLTANYAVNRFNSAIRIIDPFCGDGRLILKLLPWLMKNKDVCGKHLYISIWDIDATAVEIAKRDIKNLCTELSLDFELDARVSDAFVEYKAVQGWYDICVTNPPWGLLKPQKLFGKSNDEQSLQLYRVAIEKYDSYMVDEFALSQPSKKFGKWGTNLARCGTEVALRLINREGMAGIVSPASFLNDQVSSKLRTWMFEHFRVLNISFYPAEMKLYGSADISSVTIVLKGGETDQSLDVKIYSAKDTFKEKKIEKAVFEYIKRNDFLVPLKTGIEAIGKWSDFKRMTSVRLL